jgi:hypothetical protein
MPRELDVRWVTPADLSEERIAEARRALEDLAKILGRISARACHELGIMFDMDDPEVAREVMSMTFEAVFLLGASELQEGKKAQESAKAPGCLCKLGEGAPRKPHPRSTGARRGRRAMRSDRL